MDDARERPPGAPPRAEVILPDGQRLTAAVTCRRRDRSGTWWYDLQIDVPDRVDDRRRGPSLGARTVEICVPYPYCRPIPGEDYSSLAPPPPTERRRWSLAAACDGWVQAYLHRPDCAQAHGGSRVTDQEALTALADPEATAACPVCRPDRILREGPS
ncbi:DUF6233 domain-containing protein [Streptomyces caniferus]|uniref:DUF6233 domain-containing protein n=1 Tax=Streptomyces caniferus TaxID=285557 RepID=UPI0034009CA3